MAQYLHRTMRNPMRSETGPNVLPSPSHCRSTLPFQKDQDAQICFQKDEMPADDANKGQKKEKTCDARKKDCLIKWLPIQTLWEKVKTQTCGQRNKTKFVGGTAGGNTKPKSQTRSSDYTITSTATKRK
jgi:hypothetical protein